MIYFVPGMDALCSVQDRPSRLRLTAHWGKMTLIVPAIFGFFSVSHPEGFGFVAPYIFGVITVPFLIGASIWDARKAGFHPGHWKISRGVMAVFLVFVVGVGIGRGVNHYRIAKAKAFAEVAVPIIENYRKTHPKLPEFLHEIPDMPSIPALMSREFGIQEGSIRLDILNPNDYRDNWAYLSEQHQWVGWSL
jgi:hypothetical protein